MSLISVFTKSLIDWSIQTIDWLTWGRVSLTKESVTPQPHEHFLNPLIPGTVEGGSLRAWGSSSLLASFLSLRTTVTPEVLHQNRFVFLETEGQCLGKQHTCMQLNHITFRQRTTPQERQLLHSLTPKEQPCQSSYCADSQIPSSSPPQTCWKGCVSLLSSIRLDWVTGWKDHSVIGTQLSP